MMKGRILKGFKYLFLILAAIISIFPLYWMAISATNKSVDIIGGAILPGRYLIENINALLNTTVLERAMLNSFRNTIIATFFNLLICSIAGYSFQVYKSKYKDKVMGILLLSMMVPVAATLIPLFSMFGKIGLLNTMIGCILPTFSTAFMIFLFKQSAQSFPHDIIEAARIDGMGEIGIFFTMFVPIMKSTFAAATTVTFMNVWNSYLWPLVVLQKEEAKTMPLLVSGLLGTYVIDYGALMLAVTLSTLPTILVFFLLEKSFAEGITGAIK